MQKWTIANTNYHKNHKYKNTALIYVTFTTSMRILKAFSFALDKSFNVNFFEVIASISSK